MQDVNSTTNGQSLPSESSIATQLEDEVTVGYRPTLPLEALWTSGSDTPQLTFRRDIEFMQMHPIVMAGLEYYKAGISGAKFWGGPDHNDEANEAGKPISPDARVCEFVLAHCERFWQRGMPLLQEGGYPHGWAAGEHIYKEQGGMLTWSHLKDFHPSDSFILTGIPGSEGQYVPYGIRIKNIRNKQPVELWFASESIPAKACWYPHRPRFNHFYGRSQLMGPWRPWRRLGWRDCVEQVIDAAIYRAGYVGPIVKHPMEDSQTAMPSVPATALDGRGQPRRSARDVARQMVEWAKAGAGFTMSSAKYPQAMGGGEKWELIWPDHVMDVRPLIEAAKYLEDQILLGMGVPPELIRAGGTGSGYSGRSIPREAFLDGQQRIADAMLQIFVEQVLRPLVLWNFGDVPFEVSCKSLLATQVGDKQGDEQQPVQEVGGDQAGAGPRPKSPKAAPAPPPTQPQVQGGQAMSNEQHRSKVLEVVRRVLRRGAA